MPYSHGSQSGLSPNGRAPVGDRSAKRLSDGSDWILEVCRRFTEASNWPLVFTPAGNDTGQSAECCWSSTLTQRGKPIGRLHFELPQDPGNDRNFLAVCEQAELISQLLSQALSASYSLDLQKRNTAVLLEADAGTGNGTAVSSLRKYLHAAADVAEFRAAAFFLLSPDVKQLQLRLTHNIDSGSAPKPIRILGDRPIDIRALEGGEVTISAGGDSVYRDWLPESFRTGHCVAVRSESGPAGTLWLYDRRMRSLDDEERQTISAIAGRMGEVLERVVLLRESDLHQRQNRDLKAASVCWKMAAGVQHDDRERYAVSSVCASRYEIGGDLCEIIPLDEDRLFFLVGDGSGDSVPAAMVMSAARGAVRSQIEDLRSGDVALSRMMEKINSTLNEVTASHQFMTLVIGLVDFENRTLTYTNAGHPPLILLRSNEASELSDRGMLAGVSSSARYDSATIDLEPNDVIVGFTDGIHEASGETGKIFGIDRVREVIAPLADVPVEEILATIQDSVADYAGAAAEDDDNTLMVLRVK